MNKNIELLKKAIVLEKDGYDFYTKLSGQLTEFSIKSFFNQMATDEMVHANWLEEMSKEAGVDSRLFKYIEIPHDNFVFDMSDLPNTMWFDFKQSIELALTKERDSITYYEGLKSNSTSEEKEILNKIIKWEETHIEYINEIKLKNNF